MARIGIEQSLSDIKQTLQNQGHEVFDLNQSNAADCDYCVISGQDKNMMGITETVTNASVINAQGMTAQEVAQQIGQRQG